MITQKILFLALILLVTINAQQRRRPAVIPFHSQVPFYAEVHVVPSDSLNVIDYLYKIPYNQLVFVKQDDHYEAELSLSVEVFDTSKQFIQRQIKDDHIMVDDFGKTNSPELYAQGVIKFKLANQEYDLVPSVTDKQSGQEAKLNHFRVKKLNPKFLDFLLPIVTNGDKISFENDDIHVVTNFEGFIPFDKNDYHLIFPCVDTSVNKINVTMINEHDTVFSGTLKDSYLSSNSFTEYDGNIVIKNEPGKKTFRNFTLGDFSNKLKTGDLKIIVSKSDSTKYSENYFKQVIWFNKPFSLRDPEFAIKALKYMVSDSVVNKVMDVSKDKYGESLSEFWDKYDPTPETEFNELMNEYYLRVDFALRNFGTIAGKSGADTDRGKIFIKFGKPSYIERSSDEYGHMVERWVYKKERLNFIFIDKTGTGDFPLVKG